MSPGLLLMLSKFRNSMAICGFHGEDNRVTYLHGRPFYSNLLSLFRSVRWAEQYEERAEQGTSGPGWPD